jgi:hypothetical protein
MRTTIGFAVSVVIAAALAQSPAGAVPVGTAFTYQGVVEKNGTGINGACSIRFSLYDAVSGGSLVGGPNPNTVAVTAVDGAFTTMLDFGASAFNGNNGRWLEIEVQGPGDLGYTTLTPRQPVTPVPYALHALSTGGGGTLTLPFSGSITSGANAVDITNGGSGAGVYGSGGFAGVWGSSTLQYGILGETTAGASGGVRGRNYGSGPGVEGIGSAGNGVQGTSASGNGVTGTSFDNGMAGVYGYASFSNATGVKGESGGGYGVRGVSSTSTGIQGESGSGFGIYGTSSGSGMAGVFGQTSINNTAGVLGRNESGGPDAQGVFGYASSGAIGVLGISEGNDGIVGRSNAPSKSGIWAYSTNPTGYGGAFSNTAGGVALLVSGLAQVSTLQILGGSDLAEPFDISATGDGGEIAAGMVVVIDENAPGDLRLGDQPYDTRVAGVISGANGLAPGMVMKASGDPLADGARPVAMSGRVWCWVDATAAPVVPGDLLTTSATPGHAMKAADGVRRGGATLGKAMTALAHGRGLVLVLVSLQ